MNEDEMLAEIQKLTRVNESLTVDITCARKALILAQKRWRIVKVPILVWPRPISRFMRRLVNGVAERIKRAMGILTPAYLASLSEDEFDAIYKTRRGEVDKALYPGAELGCAVPWDQLRAK